MVSSRLNLEIMLLFDVIVEIEVCTLIVPETINNPVFETNVQRYALLYSWRRPEKMKSSHKARLH